MKAYTVTDRNGDEGTSLVIFAETAGKAKAYAAHTDTFCDYGFTGLRVNRISALDSCYRGKPEMDWLDMDDRVAMVRYADFECSPEVDWSEERCMQCDARTWCGRFEMMTDR